MKIDKGLNTESTMFYDLQAGETFIYENDNYIKAIDKNNSYYAIRLRDGHCYINMDYQMRVPKIKTKIVLDND
ncbi:hypothetical protein [Gilliamella apis]|uniref:Uncharacterized protein n=1 Tax=Gilliamella apis TaxID=1970738 RepID=A0A242NVR8_9GAMM|nr:hypothetical protein [Gilliamella apis]OTQ36566.1 hypothetical protein B6C84_02340 [Gilliamella apis]OTQ36946.1 hypothetical protein B6C88_07580 [Gilliamella apis]OTQ38801.1 hypothetical protein B6D26_11240 [Gilliamella apis]OTQ40473.1 hypothetical protein B6C94_10235 [Gilliamella apis]OTQ45284.1 hypothetical protein B6C86_08010 [Gilliamella apis]